MSFQKKATRIAGIILIIALIFIGWSIYNESWNVEWPSDSSPCPDYWVLSHNDDITYPGPGQASCSDKYGLNSSDTCQNTINIDSNRPWDQEIGDEICKKSKWAKDCGVKWDGYTNNILACEKKD